MRIAVDTNILFSAIYRPGKSIDVLVIESPDICSPHDFILKYE